jgi:hypothetical protein
MTDDIRLLIAETAFHFSLVIAWRTARSMTNDKSQMENEKTGKDGNFMAPPKIRSVNE